ncbi:MAG: PHP domain-containing protein [Gemmatimonadaceae bacterium]
MSDASLGGPLPEFIDLHTHSTASDGARKPADVVRAARAAGLAALALTDHDTLSGIPEATAMGAELGIRIIPGIELSAVDGDVETHVLGLHLSHAQEMEHRLVEIREMRVSRASRMVERLNALGIPVAFDAVLAEAAGGAVGRPHVARAIIAGGWCRDFREAFERYLGNGKLAFVAKDSLPLADAIALIHRAGGIAVLAHPGGSAPRERVALLVGQGLDGLEVLHPGHSWDESQRLDALVSEFDLVRSGGSDWHGATDGSRSLGMMRVPHQWLRAQEARAATIGSRRVA